MAIKKQSKIKRVNKPKDESTEILHLLLKIQIAYPEWRFGQIISNAVRAYDGRVNCDTFHMQDEELLEGLERLLNEK